MWPFKRNKTTKINNRAGPICSHCNSTNTVGLPQRHLDIKIWRGQRYWTWRCLDCERDFYTEVPYEVLKNKATKDDENELIDNEEELQVAEDEIRKNIEEEEDRRCR